MAELLADVMEIGAVEKRVVETVGVTVSGSAEKRVVSTVE